MSDCATPLPQRKPLPHQVPSWVRQGARHFITLNAAHCGTTPFLDQGAAASLLRNLLHYHTLDKWCLWTAVIMPDHLHFIATFNLSDGIAACVTSWKGYQTRQLGVAFQSGYFEHRLRNDDEFVEKSGYVLANPVRKGFVSQAIEWPYSWSSGVIEQ